MVSGCIVKLSVPLRSGNWNNAGNCGLAALNLNNVRSNVNSNVGLRLALVNIPEASSEPLAVTAYNERTIHPRQCRKTIKPLLVVAVAKPVRVAS